MSAAISRPLALFVGASLRTKEMSDVTGKRQIRPSTQSPGCGPPVLDGHDASNGATELRNSSSVCPDAAGNSVKFTVPTVANDKVYVRTCGDNTGVSRSSRKLVATFRRHRLRSSNEASAPFRHFP